MLDYIIMGGILAFLFFLIVYKSKYNADGNNHFFDQNNSKAMRGFWCLIVILVHIPPTFQNKIQDMIGSFAYIGVTFFFMTSAYGLSAGVHKNPNSIKRFWMARLPKLIIPNWATNLVFALLFLFIFGDIPNIRSFININGWVKWLLGCYIAFWIGYRFDMVKKYRKLAVCFLVFLISISFYCLQHAGIVTTVTWCPEVVGFIWGIILFAQYDKIKAFFLNKWVMKVFVACLLALLLGVSYLLFKGIIFWGDYVLKIILGLSILSFILILNSKFEIGNRISYFLGDISFEVYLIHSAVFRLIARILPNISSGVFIILSIAVTVCFAWLIHIGCKLLLKHLK